MDETKVPTYPLVNLIPTHPTVDNEKYPKVGDPNPVVKLGVVDADKGKVALDFADQRMRKRTSRALAGSATE